MYFSNKNWIEFDDLIVGEETPFEITINNVNFTDGLTDDLQFEMAIVATTSREVEIETIDGVIDLDDSNTDGSINVYFINMFYYEQFLNLKFTLTPTDTISDYWEILFESDDLTSPFKVSIQGEVSETNIDEGDDEEEENVDEPDIDIDITTPPLPEPEEPPKTRLQIARERLTMYLAAEKAILEGAQSYQIGHQSLTRANLAEIRKAIMDLEQLIAGLSGQRNIRRIATIDD